MNNEKSNVCRCLQKYRTVKTIKLEGKKTTAVKWYTSKCLPEILQEVNVKGIMLPHDNASSNTARSTVELVEQKHFKVIEDPTYSPDFAT